MRFIHFQTWLPILAALTTLYAETSNDLNQQGIVAYKNGELEQAYNYFAKALKQSPDNTAITNNLVAACHSYATRYQKMRIYL